MQVNRMAEQPVTMTPTDHPGADAQHRSYPQPASPRPAKAGANGSPQITPLVAPQIGPDPQPGLGTLPVHKFHAPGL